MRHWAAIDVLGGRVVTLKTGNPSNPTDWHMSTSEAAKRWADQGAYGLHIVDLDGALGEGANQRAVASALKSVDIPVEVGGGIRSLEDVLMWLEMGASRVVIGTLALTNLGLLEEIVTEAGPDKVAVALDFRGGRLLTKGWREEGPLDIFQEIQVLAQVGASTVIATDAARDGTATGPDMQTFESLRRATPFEFIASGGIRTAEDVAGLDALRIDGVILGRALYERTIILGELKGR